MEIQKSPKFRSNKILDIIQNKIFNPNTNPAINKIGNTNHPKNIIIPVKIIRISIKSPIKIKKTLNINPITRENKLETKTSNHFPIWNILG